MKLLINAFKKVFKLYLNSFLEVHVIIIVASLILNYVVSTFVNSSIISENYVSLLNGMGVLTSFFILVIDKMSLTKLNKKYNKLDNIPITRKEIRQGSKALNLIFSITFSLFFLLIIQYILLFLDILFLLLLILSVFNVFAGFCIVLVLWHGLESSEIS